MATFTQNVSQPSPQTGVQAAPADDSLARLFNTASDAVGVLGGAATTAAQDNLRVRSDAAISEATSGLLGLEEERDVLIGADRQLNNQIANIYRDGNVTDQEREILRDLETQKSFLDEAKSSGILSRSGYSTRFNALYRQAKASAENLGIQSQIDSLFLNQRSLVEAAPIADPQQQAVNAVMDNMHGPGNWTAEQAADFMSRRVQSDTVLKGLNTQRDLLLGAANTQFEGLITSFITHGKSRGVFTPQEQQDGVILVQQTASTILQDLNTKRQEITNQGRMTDEINKSLTDTASQVMAMRDNYVGVLQAEEGTLKGLTSADVLDRAQKATEAVAKYKLTASQPYLNAISQGKGPYGEMGAGAFLEIIDESSANYGKMLVLRSQTQGIPVDLLREQDARMMALITTGDLSPQELEQRGLLSHDQAIFASSQLTYTKPSTKEDVDAVVKFNDELSPVANDPARSTKNIRQLNAVFDRELANATTVGAKDSLKRSFDTRLNFYFEDLHRIEGQSANTISFSLERGGSFSMSTPDFGFVGTAGAASPSVPLGDDASRNQLRTYLSEIGAYVKKGLEAGVITEADVMKRFGSIDSVTGAGESSGAIINRNVEQGGEGSEEARVDAEPLTGVEQSVDPSPIVTLPEGVTEQVDADLAVAIRLEGGKAPSADQPNLSGSSAVGILQIMPKTAQEMGVDPTDPNQSIQAYKQHRDSVGELLQKNGLEASGLNTYLTWQQGRSGGVQILKSSDKLIGDLPKTRINNMKGNTPSDTALGKMSLEEFKKQPVSKWLSVWERKYSNLASKVQPAANPQASTQDTITSELVSVIDQLPADATASEIREFILSRNRS